METSNKFALFPYLLKVFFIIFIPLFATIFNIWKFFLVVAVPFRLDYAEGFVFSNSISALHGVSIYRLTETAPYIFGFYTPLYNYIGSLFLSIFGTEISILRILSFIFFLATGYCVAWIVKKNTKSTIAALLSAVLLYSSFIVSQWSAIARPDMLGLFLIALGISVSTLNKKSKGVLVVIAALFALAFFAKQQFVFAPLALCLTYLFENKKKAVFFGIIYVFFLGMGILTLSIFTNGEFTKQIFLYAGSVPYTNLYTAFRIIGITCVASLPLLFLATRRITSKPKNFFSVYLLCTLISFVMLVRDGGIQNYLLEFILALILISVTSLSWEKIEALHFLKLIPLIIIFQFFFLLWSYSAFPWEIKQYVTERKKLFNKEISSIEPGSRLLTEDPLIAFAIDSEITIDPYTFGQLIDSHLLSSVNLFSEINTGTYLYIDDYGAFNRIPNFESFKDDSYDILLELRLEHPVKPFDYSLYNKNLITDIGTLYVYNPQKSIPSGL